MSLFSFRQLIHRTRTFALLSIAALLVISSLSVPAQEKAHPLEGTYEVSGSGSVVGSFTFALSIKRDGEKWSCAITGAPAPMDDATIKVEADNKITITAGSGSIMISGMLEEGKLKGKWEGGGDNGEWTGVRKSAEKKS